MFPVVPYLDLGNIGSDRATPSVEELGTCVAVGWPSHRKVVIWQWDILSYSLAIL